MSKLDKLKSIFWKYIANIGTGICFLFICYLILFREINRYSFFIAFIGWTLIGYCRGRSDEMLAQNKAIQSALEEYLQNYNSEREEQTAQEIRENMHHVD
jgi:hypothetical protein